MLLTFAPIAGRRSTARRRGLGLIELLTIVALLMITLALMVSTARHVRSTSANELTRKRMAALATAAAEAIARGVDPTIPFPATPAPSTSTSRHAGERPSVGETAVSSAEDRLHEFAVDSSRALAERLAEGQPAVLPNSLPGAIAAAASVIPELNDAWGQPIALMPRQVPAVGMAPDDGPFLVSAGPDGRFLTLSDNIYSYDLPALLPRVKSVAKNGVVGDPVTPAR